MFEGIRKRLGEQAKGHVSPWAATLRQGRAVAPDGTSIFYEVVGEGDRTILFANGLGGRRYAWEDIYAALYRDYRLITWDYRGLFESIYEGKRRLAVVHHAEDIDSILDAEGVTKAVLFGWSMGVQVSLQFAANHPQTTRGLVLVNGTYGHALSTSLQPFFSVPGLPKRVHGFLEWFRAHPELASAAAKVARLGELPTALAFSLTAGPELLKHRRLFRQYFDDVLGDSFVNYLRLFQELDAHSAYHLLPDIEAPTLIISGMLDPLTPAYQSREMARRMPNAKHLKLRRAGHFALMERPEVVVPAVIDFLKQRVEW